MIHDGSARFHLSLRVRRPACISANSHSLPESKLTAPSGIYAMLHQTPRYPFALFQNLPLAKEADFVDRVRLYARAMTFLFAQEFQWLTGSTAQEREANRLRWFGRTTSALEGLCHVRSSFDDWAALQPPCADAGWSPTRWACGFATLTSLIVEPQVMAAHAGIQEHCGHLSAFLSGHDQRVSIYSTDAADHQRPTLHFSVHGLQSIRRPDLTPIVLGNINEVAERHLAHIVGLVQLASSPELLVPSINRFRRCLAEVALGEPQVTDAHEVLTKAMHGNTQELAALARSFFSSR